jgi:hypothetical protein
MKKTAFYLIALVSILITSLGAMAQGGLAPLVNSTHTYSVTPGNAGNNFAWSIVEGSSPTDYVITDGSATTASILWKTAGTYTLQFRETSSTSCITLISKTVVVSANTFNVVTPALLSPLCNEASGVANYSASTVATTVQYAVNMVTGIPSFNPNWEFIFTLTPSSGATISSVTTSAGSITGTGPYTVTGITSATGTGSVTITLELTGNVNTAHTVAIAITSAKELSYNTPSIVTGNKAAIQTVNAIPATTSFSSN